MSKKICQLLPTIVYGDAVSNEALLMQDIINEMGYESKIFAQNIDDKVANRVSNVKKLKLDREDILIYHMSTGSELSQLVYEMENKNKIMIYHNITPSSFFSQYSDILYKLCEMGREQLKMLNKTFLLTLTDSEYNKTELDSLGYKDTYELPIILNFKDFETEPDKKILNIYCNDGYTNIIFIGRIAPNKKHEDIIKSFFLYKKYINPKSRLFLIGSQNGMEKYVKTLKNMVLDYELKDVFFVGKVSFKEILAYYRIASVFLCMSEHEGFCVPLVESMIFKVPIIAYESSAIPSTLGKSGILVKEKKYEMIAELIDMLEKDKEFRDKVIASQIERLKFFDYNRTKKLFIQYLKEII